MIINKTSLRGIQSKEVKHAKNKQNTNETKLPRRKGMQNRQNNVGKKQEQEQK